MNIGELLPTLGVPQDICEAELLQAHRAYSTRWDLEVALPQPQKDLQTECTDGGTIA